MVEAPWDEIVAFYFYSKTEKTLEHNKFKINHRFQETGSKTHLLDASFNKFCNLTD